MNDTNKNLGKQSDNIAKKSGKKDTDIIYFNSLNHDQMKQQQPISLTKQIIKSNKKLIFDFSDLYPSASIPLSTISNNSQQSNYHQLPIIFKNNQFPFSLSNTHKNKVTSKKNNKTPIADQTNINALIQGNITQINHPIVKPTQQIQAISFNYPSNKINQIQNKHIKQNFISNSNQSNSNPYSHKPISQHFYSPIPTNQYVTDGSANFGQIQEITNLPTFTPTSLLIENKQTGNTQNTHDYMTKLLIEAIQPQYQQLTNFNQKTINQWTEFQQQLLLQNKLNEKLQNFGHELLQQSLNQQKTITKLQQQNQYLNQQIKYLQSCFTQFSFDKPKNNHSPPIFQTIQQIQHQITNLSKNPYRQTKQDQPNEPQLKAPPNNISQQFEIQLNYIYTILDSISTAITTISKPLSTNI